MISNTDPKTGIRYGVIPLKDLEPWFAFEEFYDNSENLAIKEVETELNEIFDTIKEFTKERNIDKDVEIENLKDSIKEDLFEFWDESEDSRVYDHEGYRMQLIDGDLFITESLYITLGPLCSPCAPGAVDLTGADGKNGFVAYCLPDDFFEDGKAPYEYIAIEEGYNKLWKQLYPEDKMPSMIADMNDLMKFLNRKETEETDIDVLHWIRTLKQNVVLLIESATDDPNSDKVKFYLTSVRLQIGIVNEMKRREEEESQ